MSDTRKQKFLHNLLASMAVLIILLVALGAIFPEVERITEGSMLFCAGVATGLLMSL